MKRQLLRTCLGGCGCKLQGRGKPNHSEAISESFFPLNTVIHIYIYIHVCMYTHVYIYIHIYIYIFCGVGVGCQGCGPYLGGVNMREPHYTQDPRKGA